MRWLLGFLYLFLVFLLPVPALSNPMDLKDLVSFGLENAPTMKVARNSLQTKKLATKNAFASFLPSLDISATHGYQDGDPSSTANPWASTLNVGLTETLYDNGSNLINYDIAKVTEQKARLEFEKERNAFCLKVLKEYYGYSQTLKLFGIQKFQHEILLRQFKSLEGKYRRGEKTRTEYLRFKARVQRSELTLMSSENDIANSLVDLKALIGFSGPSLQVKPLEIQPDSMDLKPAAPLAVEGHFDSNIVAREKTINDSEARLVERKYYPQVFLTAGMSYTNSDYLGGSDDFESSGQTSWNTLLTLKYNLWDWGSLRRDVSTAKLSRDSSNASLDLQLLNLESELSKLVVDLNQQKKDFLLNQELVNLETGNYKSIEKDYRSGRATFLDLVNAVDNLTSAKQSLTRNFFRLSQLMAEYEYHTGKLYENILRR